jgi:hypothetical protein
MEDIVGNIGTLLPTIIIVGILSYGWDWYWKVFIKKVKYRRVLLAFSVAVVMTYIAMIPFIGLPILLLAAPIHHVLNTYLGINFFNLYFKVWWHYLIILMYYFILLYGFLIIRSKLRTWIKSQKSNNILFADLNPFNLGKKENINFDTQTFTDNNYSQNNISSQPSPTSYSQASTQSSPQISFAEQENLTPTNITQPSPNTPLQEIQSEYKSNQNPTESFTEKIQNHYNTDNTVNATQEYVVKSNLSKIRNTIFSGFLILGFLAFALISLGGIIVGDLTVSGVLAVASIILVIDGYLFYLMWFKR